MHIIYMHVYYTKQFQLFPLFSIIVVDVDGKLGPVVNKKKTSCCNQKVLLFATHYLYDLERLIPTALGFSEDHGNGSANPFFFFSLPHRTNMNI